jgi:hypothetical protein
MPKFTVEPLTPATFPFANVIGTILASGRFAESVSCHHMRNFMWSFGLCGEVWHGFCMAQNLPDRPFMGFMRASILPPELLVKGE